MSRWEKWAFNALNLAVAASGILYFWMKYLLQADDPFAVVNHPWQPAMLAAHVAAAPLLMVLFGVIFRSHVLAKLAGNGRRARLTGWSSLLSFTAMAGTGYLIQVLADPAWLRFAEIAHVVTGALFLVGYSAHLAVGWRLARTPSPSRAGATTLPRRPLPS